MRKSRKLFAIFGDPVSHSISPLMHNYAIRGLGIDACYTRYRLEDGARLAETFRKLQLSGVNVTVPHKEAAYRACDRIEGIANEIEAVNTIVLQDGKLVGYNTDAPGFLRSALEMGAVSSVCILGAGGTAKAIASAFKARRNDVTIINRSPNRLDWFEKRGYLCMTWETFKAGKRYDLLVNTTSAGLQEASLPAPKLIVSDLLKHTNYAIDVIYNKMTPFLQAAKDAGIPCKDGSEMLLYQGVIAFTHFFAHQYSEKEVEVFMKRAFV